MATDGQAMNECHRPGKTDCVNCFEFGDCHHNLCGHAEEEEKQKQRRLKLRGKLS